jgi:glycosyltransferase involved in cell wall biosynthesis
MRILAIHNYHRKDSASGDDQVFKSETALLEGHGNEVIKYTVSNDYFDNSGIVGKILSTFGMLWSIRNYKAVKTIIKRNKPDIVHVHTFFPLLSPSVLYAAKHCGCKVVATLHDTRFVCPCATSLRNGKICNKCGDGHYLRMCKYGCFKNSKLQSFIVACIFKYYRMIKTFYEQIDKYVCLNNNQIQLLKDIGFEEKKIVKKYNFVPDTKETDYSDEIPCLPKKYVVFYGRIGEEKGICVLQKVWEMLEDIPLVVMGGGPLKEEFKHWVAQHNEVHYLGYTKHDLCLKIVENSEFVFFPSICYEGCSMVQIEAESLGRATIATDLGFSVEAIKNGINGYKVPLNDIEGFVKIIRKLWINSNECKVLGQNARLDYEKKYMPEDNYNRLIEIYKELLQK